jgi:hypothetical protein
MAMALNADGQLVATADYNESQIYLRDRDTGRLLRTLDTGTEGFATKTFAPEGRLLASAGRARDHQTTVAQVWDADSGREHWRRQLVYWGQPSFSPDGRLLAGFGRDQVLLLEAATGKELRSLPFRGGIGLAFSPTGRTLTCRDEGGITLLELASGKERCRMPVDRDPAEGVTPVVRFSPDGRWLAGGGKHGAVHVWDASRGRLIRSFAGHDSMVTALAFTPDSRVLISGSLDSTMLVWDMAGVTAPLRASAAYAGDADVPASWKALADADAKAAFRAMQVLIDAPERSLPLLREQLRPVLAVDPKQLGRWLAALDSDQFAERQRAETELEKHGNQVEAALRQFLAAKHSLEAKRRAEQVLARLQGPVTDPQLLRQLRAVEVLEFIGTAEAREILRTLGSGALDAKLTQEAAASLRRLGLSGRR